MTDTALSPDTQRARRNVMILVLAQAFLGAQMSMIFTIGGLAGQSLATNLCFSTLPISATVLGSMMAATPLSAAMQRWGRRVGFWIGTGSGTIGAGIGAYALLHQSFWLFVLGGFFTGVYQSAQGFFRFAATDTADESFRPKAISYVMAGGLASAIIGPQLVKVTSQAMVVPFLGTYLAVIAINIVGSLLFLFLDIPKPPVSTHHHLIGRSRMELLKTPRIAVAIIIATTSYALMNLVMTSTPLAVVGCGFEQNTAANIVSAHVIAMFLPSFFTGYLIAKFGVERIMSLGLIILGAAGVVAMMGVELENFFGALILLGVGWNFGFIGATAMLSSAHEPSERGRVQGMNDLIVFGGVTLASLASGGLLNCSGGSAQDGWIAVNLTMIPLLTLAGAALIWLWMQPKNKG
ncbi:MFS transporter [Celeribacter ethanolicus]|uniref:MFS transporter n=1 Tax=Celeribacter ethanolicus TaxID=1758178 RepID=UPI000837314B|nr:MFS transporter [Celeribacter ethanolicus]TNE66332.1 MAG: MFS transporter [Paracoccaceae bacterium]